MDGWIKVASWELTRNRGQPWWIENFERACRRDRREKVNWGNGGRQRVLEKTKGRLREIVKIGGRRKGK